MRIAKVHRNPCVLAQLFVQCHLPALVVRHAPAHGLGNAQQFVGEALQDIGSAGGFEVRQLDQHHQPAGALNQGAYGAGVARSLDEIALPVPRELAVFNLWRAHVDAEHVGDFSTAVLPLAARHSLVVRVAQGGNQLFAQLPHRQGIDAVVDGLVRHA